MKEWIFDSSGYWWKSERCSVYFEGYLDGNRYVFGISQEAINDYFESEDTKDEAIKNFVSNFEKITDLAKRYASMTQPCQDIPNYFITSDTFKRI